LQCHCRRNKYAPAIRFLTSAVSKRRNYQEGFSTLPPASKIKSCVSENANDTIRHFIKQFGQVLKHNTGVTFLPESSSAEALQVLSFSKALPSPGEQSLWLELTFRLELTFSDKTTLSQD